MQTRDFCFWLQGFFELQPGETVAITAEQAVLIKRHLSLVFQHDKTMEHEAPGKFNPNPSALDALSRPFAQAFC